MKQLIRWTYLLLIGLLMCSNNLFATHYMGNEITYTCLGNNQYEVNLTIYSDCAGFGFGTAQVIVSSGSCGSFNQGLTLSSNSPTEITPACPSVATDCNGGSIPGYEKYEFSGVVTLTGNCSDWSISYSGCCRNPLGGNLMNSTMQSFYHVAYLDDNLASCNNSPEFIEDAPMKVGCVNDTSWISFGAFDADGDSLVYSLDNGWTAQNTPVNYMNGLSGQNPFIGITVIDPNTGSLMVLPTVAQSGYLNVKVEEYRNGVKIGEISREVILNFTNCASNTAPKVTDIGGQYSPSGVLTFTIYTNSTFSISPNTFDAEVAAGTQVLSSAWSQLPVGSASTAGSIPSFSWTPTSQDIGTHLITLSVMDDACPYFAENTYSIWITVLETTSSTSSTNSATIVAGTTQDVCLDLSNLSGNLTNVTLLSDSLDNATINSIDLATGCVNISGDSIAIDMIVFLLCDGAGNCDTSQLTLDVQQGVWPGDTDLDKTVDNFDLLNIGLGYGTGGTPRTNASILWDGYLTPDWNKFTPVTQINYKHVDCNGDGLVDINDTLAISNNWGSFYSHKSGSGGGAGSVPILVDGSNSPTTYNWSLPILLGTPMVPANDVYGVAFTIVYDTSLIKANSVNVEIDNSWLGTVGTDLISIRKDFYTNGVIQVGITRTDGANASGHGVIGSLNFTIQDDIMLMRGNGDTSFVFDVVDVLVIDNSEGVIPVNPRSSTMVLGNTTSTNLQFLENDIDIYPNPVQNMVNITSQKSEIQSIELMNINGQVLISETVNATQKVMNTSEIANGIYILSIMTDEGILNKKISILK